MKKNRPVPKAMDWVMEEIPEQIFAAASSTTTTPTTTTVDDDISWDGWSPDLSWSDEDIQPLILASAKSELDPAFIPAAGHPSADFSPPFIQGWSSNTSSVTTTSSGGFSADGPISPVAFPDKANKGERLLHLLTAAAEALSGDRSTRDLARVILVRLKELNTASSSMERLIAHFTVALQGILDGDVAAGTAPRRGETDKLPYHQYPAEEVLMAFHLLQDMSPFASFGHLTANQAILEASAGERRVHIIDYDIAEGVQWASLIQAMASGTNKVASAAPPHLKITAITNGTWKSATRAQDAGRRLSAFAESVGQPFSFRMCRLNQKKMFQPAAVKVVKGELVVVNCALHPAQLGHAHCSSASVCSFLAGAAALGARLITIVEEESVAGTSEQKGKFFPRFMNELERYTAVWESLEAGFPRQERVRDMVERVLLGPRIAEALRRAYGLNNGLEAAAEGCGKWMVAAGFEKIGLSYFNLCQARLLLGLFNDGYRVEEEASNKLVLSWKSCRLISASVWKIPAAPSPSPSPSPSPPFGSIYL